jgi:hypothetical protein
MAIMTGLQIFNILFNGLEIVALVLGIMCMIKYLKK